MFVTENPDRKKNQLQRNVHLTLTAVSMIITTAVTGRHGVKVRPRPQDPGPPSKFKSGTRDPPKVYK